MPATGPTRPLPITDLDELRAALGQDERERFVIEMRYGLADGRQHSLAWIGRRLRLSAERVRQLESQALERLASQGGTPPPPRPNGQRAPDPPSEAPRAPARQRFLRPWTLLLLWLEPAHGADLRERLAALGMPGADYRFLRRLEAEGLLRSTWAQGEGVGPDRRVYSLTEAGMEQLERDAEALANVADALAAFLDSHGRRPAA